MALIPKIYVHCSRSSWNKSVSLILAQLGRSWSIMREDLMFTEMDGHFTFWCVGNYFFKLLYG